LIASARIVSGKVHLPSLRNFGLVLVGVPDQPRADVLDALARDRPRQLLGLEIRLHPAESFQRQFAADGVGQHLVVPAELLGHVGEQVGLNDVLPVFSSNSTTAFLWFWP